MKPRILVVEDGEGPREVSATLLEAEGYEVTRCDGRAQVAAALDAGPPDLAIVDVALAGGSGIDILADLRERLPRCPVIMVAGAPGGDAATEALRRGAFDCMVKPVRQDTLLRACRLGLEHKALLEEREVCRASLEAIFNGLRDVIVMVDDRMRVVKANRSSLCGLDAAPMVGRQFEEVSRCADPRCAALLRETLRTGRPADLERVECAHPGGALQVVALSTTPLKSGQGAVTGALLVVKDQTRLATLERQLNARHGAPPGSRRLEDLPPRERILKAIERAGGNRSEAAKLLGWSRRTFYRKLAEHRITRGGRDTGG